MALNVMANPYKMLSHIKKYNYNYVLYLIFVLSIFYILMPRQYFKLYNSILGKLIALGIVMYLTTINIGVGLLSAIIVMLSYNSLIEGMENKGDEKVIKGESKLDIEIKKANDEHEVEKEKIKKELERKQNSIPEIKEAISRFKLDHCLNGKLVKNNMEEIKLSNLKEYFPQISFEDKLCNPCDPKCNFTMTSFDERITVEEKLRPKETNTVSVS